MFTKHLVRKHALKVAMAAALFTLSAGAALADPMYFAGSTTGVFTSTGTTTDKSLSFNSGNFAGSTSSSGFVSFGTTSAKNSFGTFTLTKATDDYNNDPFALTIDFTSPLGIDGGQSSSFDATVFGSVTRKSGGGVEVTFNPFTEDYSFANGSQSGTFTLNLNNVAIGAGDTSIVTGYITSTVTPEPNSLMLLGTGFVSAAGMLMRRRKMASSL